ncbi:MAG TPA: 2-C-methyl-D-erythritol 4-phosphate cytidylyltransferase [Elusimicrobiales bacterium]|nr:2-C-methyl-D-erythritol 4-phosphate cytidylyltransferase [Elusimicrobiales bacterium]
MAAKNSEQNCAAIIVAGGKGTRMGGPKQCLDLCGKPLLLHSVETFRANKRIKHLVVVSDAKTFKQLDKEFQRLGVRRANGGETRLQSVRNGLRALPECVDLVAVHDGARPLVSDAAINECLDAAARHGAAVPAAPVKDTLKESDGRFVAKTPDRKFYWAAQTPQCYRFSVLTESLAKFPKEKDSTDESSLVEKAGHKVALVKSDYSNIKITTPEDLLLAQALMAKTKGTGRNAELRIGIGYDIHRMVPGRPLFLGGLQIPHSKGMLGHSDGDALLHAVCDAMLGAVSAGEIGIYFPPTDLTIMGISSRVIAEKTLEVLRSKNAELVQLDSVIVGESPKLMTHYAAIRKSLAEIFGLDESNVSVKAKSHEGMGELGRGEALSCHVIVMVRKK